MPRLLKYGIEFPTQAQKLCLLGATDTDLSDFFEVTEDTIENWKKEHQEFFDAVKNGREQADATVAQRLFKRATGYEHTEEKVFNANGEPIVVTTTKRYPPDTSACIFWLKNRQPAKWRDRQEHKHNHTGEIKCRHTTDDLVSEIDAIIDNRKSEFTKLNGTDN